MASAEPPRHHTTTEAVKEPCVPLAIEPSRVVLYGIIINMQGYSAFGRGDPDPADLALPTFLGEAGRGRTVTDRTPSAPSATGKI
jgi:hypothetical protein